MAGIFLKAFEDLKFIKEKMGTDRATAAYLGYTESYINSFLKGRRKIPKNTALFITMKAEQLKKELDANG